MKMVPVECRFFVVLSILCGSMSVGSFAADAPLAEPWRSAVGPQEEVLDTWMEGSGYGSDHAVFRRIKVQDRASGKHRVITCDAAGKAISDSEQAAMRAATFKTRIHPDLLARFAAASAATEATQTVIVWFRVPKARENAIRALWDRAAEPDEATPDAVPDNNAAEAARRLKAVEDVEKHNATARQAVAARFTAEAEAFQQQAGIPPAQVIYRYQFGPALIAKLTLAECRRLEASGLINYLFPVGTATPELNIATPAMRAAAGQQARYTGAGVTIGHVEPAEPVATNNPYLAVAHSYNPGGFPGHWHATACAGMIRSTLNEYRGMSRGCNLLNVVPISTSQADIDTAVDWAIANGASILNMSFNLGDSADGALNWADIYFDYMVHNARVFFTKSAGNQGDGTGVVTSPGRGYNSLSVGNVDPGGTTAWANDTMYFQSSYVDSETGGDKPEVAAYGTQTDTTLTYGPTWHGVVGSGTSLSSAQVAGLGGLLVDYMAGYSDEPWALKAMLMASALAHNIEGAALMSDKDGAGKAVATATKASSYVTTITDASFNTNEEYEIAWNIPLKGGETNRIVLCYTHEPSSESATPDPDSYDKCDLDLYLYVGGTRVALSTYGFRNAFEIIDYKPASNVTARVRIKNFLWDADVASVRLGVAAVAASTLGSGPDPIEDNYEQNDTLGTANDPRANGGQWENTWLQSINGLGVQADDDWYRITVTPNFNLVNVDCRFLHADGDVDLYLYNSAGTMEGSSTGASDNEYLSATVAATGGTFYIRVLGFDGNRTNRYDLWWDDVEPGPPAAPTGPIASPGLGCGVVNLSWTAVDGVIGYKIYYDEDAALPFTPTDNGTPANGAFVGNVTSVIVSNLAPTTTYYFAVISTNAGGTSTYSTVVSARTGACEDNYEQNDSRSTAADPRHNGGNWEVLWLSAISNRGVQYDADYYQIAITPGYERIQATCSFVHAEGDIDLYLVNTSGTIVASSAGYGDGESIDYTVGGGTNYLILVTGDSGGNVYDLKWDDAVRIVPLPPTTVTGSIGSACGRVNLSWNSAAGATGYRVFYDEDSGNPPFSVSDDGTPASGTAVGNVTSVTISALGSGTYYYFAVQATNANGPSDYSMQFRLRASACEDAYEENDSITNAALPGGGPWKNQWISGLAGYGVSYDRDYFRIDVTSGYERVLARCTFEQDEGNLGMSLFTSNGSLVVYNAGTNDEARIDRIVSAPGIFYLRIETLSGTGNVYNLWWNDAPRILPPSFLAVAGGTNCGEIRLAWARSSNATSYAVSYDEDAFLPYSPSVNGTPSSGSNVGNVTNVTITGLDGGQTYFLAVQARDAIGPSEYSEESLAVAGVCPPLLLGVAADTSTPAQLILRWESDYNELYDITRALGGMPTNFLPYLSGIPATPPTNVYPVPLGPSNTMFYRVEQQ